MDDLWMLILVFINQNKHRSHSSPTNTNYRVTPSYRVTNTVQANTLIIQKNIEHT